MAVALCGLSHGGTLDKEMNGSYAMSVKHIFEKLFPILLGIIVSVSLYDTFLIVLFEDYIFQLEKNPAGLWLLSLGDGDVEIFVRAKLAGTLIVATILSFMHHYRRWVTVPVTTSIAVCQLGLLAYLTLG